MPIQFKLLAGLLLIAVSMLAGGFVEHYLGVVPLQLKITQQEAATAEAQEKLVHETANHITELEVEHAKTQTVIDALVNPPTPVVRVPRCAVQATTTGVAEASGVAVQAALASRTDIQAQVAFDDFAKSLESDSAEWSRAIAACQVMQGYINGLP